MPETQPQTPEGIDRTPAGEIKDQSPGNKSAEPETASTETKTPTEGTQSPEKTGKDGKSLLNQDGEQAAAPVGAPEKYEPFTAPEGFVITPEATEQLNGLFKEAGVSQASAQKLIDYIAPQLMEATQAPFQAYQEMREGWQKETVDKYGSKLPEVKTTVARALDSLGDAKLSASFREAMDLTGAGDNPAFIDVIYSLAKKVTEGTHVRGSGPSKLGQSANAKPPSAAQAMYPHLPSAG